ncbi:DUF814 domain-containing protein [Candidatus Parvarchaeota archaeon]|nr:DUF814 domain-containing protein [Candidatus Parvarchaeota archaeon]
MKITIDFRKSARQNAAGCFEASKQARKKAQGAKAALEKTREQIARLQSKGAFGAPGGAASSNPITKIKTKREKQWFEKFRWFYTSLGRLVIAGRDAAQNDLIYSKYIEDGDLFFHADIQGAPATVLKGGLAQDVPLSEKKEAAQFAASYSSAWKVASPSANVYAVSKSQLTKHAHGGFIPKGGFGITGQREWFYGTRLGIRVGLDKGGLLTSAPILCQAKLSLPCEIVPGGKEKAVAVKTIAKRTGAHPDDINQLLPSGKMTVRHV